MKENFDNEYLNQKLEPIKDVLEGDKIADYKEFGEHSYEAENGSFEFVLGETKISLKYSKPKVEELLNGKYLAASLLKHNITEGGNPYDFQNLLDISGKIIDNTRIVDEFILEKNGEQFNIGDVLLNGKIYFDSKGISNSSGFQSETNNVFLSKDPLTPEGLVTLFHELGHFKDISVGEEPVREIIKNQVKISKIFTEVGQLVLGHNNLLLEEDDWGFGAEHILARERAAWAFAIKDLKPFVSDLKINAKDLEKFVHGRCLQTYSTFIRSTIK